VSAPVVALSAVLCTSAGRTLLDIPQLTVQRDERVAIVGPNGAGKSTLLRVLSGFMPVSQGQVQVLGRSLQTPLPAVALRELRQEVGQVLQGLHLVARLTALENVLIGGLGQVRGWRRWTRQFAPSQHAQAQAALQAVGLSALANTRADQLSGGERQKVAIARLLMQGPQLILADEPTAALDPSAATEVCQLLAQAADGAALLTVVHNPALLPLLAKRVIGLRQGRIAFDLPLAQLGEQQLAELYRAEPNSPLEVSS
jgi:phosphonate transport system ATP-binding protein